VKLQPDSLAPPAQASVSCSLVNSLNLIMMIGRAQSALALAAPSSACCVLLGSIPSRCPSRSKIATSHEDRLKIATSHEDRSKIATSHEDSSETKLVRLRRCRNRRPAWIDHDVNKQVGHYTVSRSRESAMMVASPHVRPVSFACAEQARAILGSTQSLGRHSAPIRPQVPAVLLCCCSPAVKSAAHLVISVRKMQCGIF